MKTDPQDNLRAPEDDVLPEGCQESPWPQSGRFVFGPWCLLGAWPAVFGLVEEVEETKKESE